MKILTYVFNKKHHNFDGFLEIEILQNHEFNSFLKIINYQKDVAILLQNLKSITYLKKISVKNTYQNSGFGKLQINFLTKKFNNTILIVDTFKQQRQNFNLETFYLLNNFNIISYYLDFSIMYHQNENCDTINFLYKEYNHEKENCNSQ